MTHWVVSLGALGCVPPVPVFQGATETAQTAETGAAPYCGDGEHLEGVEDCDDGNPFGGDGCTPACLLPEVLSIARADAVLFGEQAGARAAGDSASVGVGDVNDDGIDDILVGALSDDVGGKDAGAAYLFHGPIAGTMNVSAADAIWRGSLPGDRLGTSVARVGDVNGDGFADVIIGAPRNDAGGNDAGTAYLFHGPVSGDVALTDAVAVFHGEVPLDQASSALFGGDVNGDGFGDVGIGARLHAKEAGAAYLMYGPVTGTVDLAASDARLLGDQHGAWAAREGAMGMDLNGDAVGDVVIPAVRYDGTGEDSGVIHVVFGPVVGDLDLAEADIRILGTAAGDFAGVSVASAGDVNADGFEDLIVGTTRADGDVADVGAAHIFFGPMEAGEIPIESADAIFRGEDLLDEAGVSVVGIGDRNGDGYDDIAVGAWMRDLMGKDTGVAYVIHGPMRGTHSLADADLTLTGLGSGDRFGDGVTAAGDVNGDGLADLLIGAAYHDAAGEDAGAVYLWLGSR